MPPSSPVREVPPRDDAPHVEYTAPRSGFGPSIGIAIIIILMLFGGLYVLGAWLNARDTQDPLPLIPGDPIDETR